MSHTASVTNIQQRLIEDQAIEWLARLRATDVTDVEKADFAEWLSQDALHKQAFDDALDLWEHVGQQLAHAPELDIPRKRFYPLAIAATLLMALASMLLFDSPGVDYVTAVGEQRRVALSDGSSMHMNTSTHIDVDFDASRRLIELESGEAFFQVAKDAQRPFEVHTPHGVVRAVGTAFAVYTKPGLTRVVVTEGVVNVITKDQLQQLAQGQSVAVSDASMQQANIDIDAALGWTAGRLIYEDIRLEEVIEDLNRYFPARMTLNEPERSDSLKDLRISTLMYLSDQDAVLDGLSATFNLKWSRVSENLILISRGS